MHATERIDGINETRGRLRSIGSRRSREYGCRDGGPTFEGWPGAPLLGPEDVPDGQMGCGSPKACVKPAERGTSVAQNQIHIRCGWQELERIKFTPRALGSPRWCHMWRAPTSLAGNDHAACISPSFVWTIERGCAQEAHKRSYAAKKTRSGSMHTIAGGNAATARQLHARCRDQIYAVSAQQKLEIAASLTKHNDRSPNVPIQARYKANGRDVTAANLFALERKKYVLGRLGQHACPKSIAESFTSQYKHLTAHCHVRKSTGGQWRSAVRAQRRL